MDREHRQESIISYLKAKPLDHGQVEKDLLLVKNPDSISISDERRQALENSFREQGSNLVPLIVRRIPDPEDFQEYEIVYGEDWFVVAQELDIDRLWVWVFDLNDEQAQLARQEMAYLASSDESILNQDNVSFQQTDPTINLGEIKEAVRSSQSQISSLAQEFFQLRSTLETVNRKIEEQSNSSKTFAAHTETPPAETQSFAASIDRSLREILDKVAEGALKVTFTLEAQPKIEPRENALERKLENVYNNLTLDGLRRELTQRGISGFNKSTRKAQLIELLMQDDAQNNI